MSERLARDAYAGTAILGVPSPVIITNSGGDYTTAPNVSFTGGGGTGYTATPNVAFTGGGGSGAMATAIMSPTTLDAVATTGILAGELLATVSIAQTAYTYQLVSGTEAETAPTIIRPDDFNVATNAKVWKLQGLYVNALTLLDGANIALGTGTGTRIGTAANQKLGLFGVAPVTQPSGENQQAVTLGNVENAIGGLTFSDPPTQAELQALSSACETLAADVRELSTLLHALRTAGVSLGSWKGG